MRSTFQKEIQILYVGDNFNIADKISTTHKQDDNRFSVKTATCVDRGLQLLDKVEIDCIVSEYKMSGRSGIEFLNIVAEYQPDIPFILYTSNGSEEVASEAISAGVTDYLNKGSDGDGHTVLVNRIISAVADRRCEQKVERRQTIKNELTEISINRLQNDEHDIDALTGHILSKIGRLTDADRTCVFKSDNSADILNNTHSWCSKDIGGQVDMPSPMSADTFPWLIQKLNNVENITIPNVSKLPPEAEATQAAFCKKSIESIIIIPLTSANQVVGFIEFGWMKEQEPWSDEFIKVLEMAGELIVNANKREQREQELRELTDRLNLAVQGANLGVWDWNIRTGSVTYNEQWAEMLGLSPEEIEPTLDTWEQRVHPEDIDEVNAVLDSHLNGETDYYGTEHRMQTASGKWKWIRDIGRVAERDDDGEPIRAVGIHMDITEQKQQQQELETSETIIQALSDAVYVLNEEGQFTYVNDEFVELVGYNRERILGGTPSLVKKESSVQRADQELARLLSDGESETATFDITVQTREGDSIICEDNIGVLPYDGDSFNGSVGTLRDVTEHRRRERRFQALVEGSNDIISVVDVEGCIQYQSPSIERILGYDPDETLSEDVWQYIHPDDRQQVSEEFETWIDNSEQVLEVIEYRAQHADGSWRWMEAKGRAQLDNSAVRGYVITSRDITERKERQQQLRLIDRVLRHNVRNDMNVIQGWANIIYNNASGDHAKYAKEIIDTSDELIETTETERKMAKLFDDSADPVSLDAVPLLQAVTETIRSEFPEASVTLNCPENITIRAKAQFSQAIEELLTNAIIHNPDDSPEAEVTLRKNAERTQIRIADTGPQIPTMEREVLIGNKKRTPLSHGSGLGLWFVQFLVARSGGAIKFKQNSPTGNIVILELPRV